MRKETRYAGVFTVLMLMAFLIGCPQETSDKAQVAAVAVNRYAESLASFQAAEIKLHEAKPSRISVTRHLSILDAEAIASKAGRGLNNGVKVAASGGDPHLYIEAARKGLQDLIAAVKANDPAAQQELTLLLNTATSLLNEAINQILLIKKPISQSRPDGANGLAMILLAFMPLAIVGSSATFTKILELLQLVAQLEPVALDLILKLTRSLKGKTVAEIAAMNDEVFDKIDAVIAAEREKIGDAAPEDPNI